jgi:hypothetical protein
MTVQEMKLATIGAWSMGFRCHMILEHSTVVP